MRQSKWLWLLLLLMLPLMAQTAQLWRRPQRTPARLLRLIVVVVAYVPRGVLAMPTAASITETCCLYAMQNALPLPRSLYLPLSLTPTQPPADKQVARKIQTENTSYAFHIYSGYKKGKSNQEKSRKKLAAKLQKIMRPKQTSAFDMLFTRPRPRTWTSRSAPPECQTQFDILRHFGH